MLNSLVAEQSKATCELALAEKQLCHDMMKRILFGTIALVAADGDPNATPAPELPRMYKDMVKARAAFPSKIHRHHCTLTTKWRGRRPRKAIHDEDSSSSSSDSDEGDEAGGVVSIPLDDKPELVRSKSARRGLEPRTSGC